MKQKTTIQDLVQKTGLSKSTISRYCTKNGYVSQANCEKIEKAMKDTHYQYEMARHTKINVSDLVMIITPLISSPVQVTLVESICAQLKHHHKKGMILHCPFQNEEAIENLVYAQKNRFAGVIILGILETEKLISLLKQITVPVVFLNQELRGMDCNVIVMDDYKAATLATQHLIEKGHQKIGFLTGYTNATAIRNREEGYLDTLLRFNLPIQKETIAHYEFSYDCGKRYAMKIINEEIDVTAVIACNDLMAAGLCNTLLHARIAIPQQISILGFDNTFLTDSLFIPLTTIDYHFDEMGKAAADCLCEEIERPFGSKRKITFLPQLIQRESIQNLLKK